MQSTLIGHFRLLDPHLPLLTLGPYLMVHRLPLDQLEGNRPLGQRVDLKAGGIADGLHHVRFPDGRRMTVSSV